MKNFKKYWQVYLITWLGFIGIIYLLNITLQAISNL